MVPVVPAAIPYIDSISVATSAISTSIVILPASAAAVISVASANIVTASNAAPPESLAVNNIDPQSSPSPMVALSFSKRMIGPVSSSFVFSSQRIGFEASVPSTKVRPMSV